MKRIKLANKISALAALEEASIESVAERYRVTVDTIKTWIRQEATLHEAYQAQMRRQNERNLLALQNRMVLQANRMVAAMDETDLQETPLNQLASTLGILLDRYLKLDPVLTTQQPQVIRIEYQYPDGSTHPAPHWATGDSASTPPFQGDRMRATLGKDRIGEDDLDSSSPASTTNMVDRSHLRDVAASLARFETDPEKRLWYES